MYKSCHNIGRRSAAERVWTYKESDIAINDFTWEADKDTRVKSRAKKRESLSVSVDNTTADADKCDGTSSEASDSCSKSSSPIKARVGSPKKEKMAANIHSGRVEKDARRVNKKCVPPMRQRVKRMACLNANAIVSLLYESGESSVKKSQRELSQMDSNDKEVHKKKVTKKDTSKEEVSKKETPQKDTPKKDLKRKEAEGAKKSGVGRSGVAKKNKVAKVKKRRQTEADRLGVTSVRGEAPVKLARRMASLNATAILTAMSDRMPKLAVSQVKHSSVKKTVLDTCRADTDTVPCATTQATPTKIPTNISGPENKTTVIDTTVELYSSVTDNDSVTFTGISDIKKMMASVTSSTSSTSPDVQITSVELPKTSPHSNAASHQRVRGVEYRPDQGAVQSSRQPTCAKDKDSHHLAPTTFAGPISDTTQQAHTRQRIASAHTLPPGGRASARTAGCDPVSYGHLQRVMPQMYFNSTVSYPSPGQPKVVNYAMVNQPLGSSVRPPVGYNMMLMSDSSVDNDAHLAARAAAPRGVPGMQLKVEKPCSAVQQASIRYNAQLFQPRYPQQNAPLDPNYSRMDARCPMPIPSRMEYGRFPLGGVSRKMKLPSSNAVEKCRKKEFVGSCVDAASEKSLHSDSNVVYGGVRGNFSASANGGYAMDHREGAPPASVIVMNSCVQGCTHERAHNSSLMGNVCMYPYPHSKGVDGADPHCQTYAVSDLGVSYEAMVPYPRSFGSAFAVPSFSGMEYPEDYSYFHSVGPDPCCLPHPLAAPHPQVKVLVHNSAGRQVVDQDGGLVTAASPHMLPTASTKAVIQPAPDSRLGQLTNLEKVARNPQTTLGKSGKEVRRSTSNGTATSRTPAKTGTGQSGTSEKSTRKSDSTKVEHKMSAKKTDTPGKTDDHKSKKDQQNPTNPKKKPDSVCKPDKKQQEPTKTKSKKDTEGTKHKKDQEATKTKKSTSDTTKANKDQPEAKKQKKAPELQKKAPEPQKKTPESAKPKKGTEVVKTKKAEATSGVKPRRDSALKSPDQLKKGDKSAARESREDMAGQRSRSTSKEAVKVTPGMKKKDLIRRSSPHGWRWQGKPEKKPVFCQVDQPPVTHDCYPSIRHDDGDVIKVRDCVLVKSGPRKKDIPFIGKVASFWQSPDNEMMMSVLWYYRPEHTETERLPQFVESEIFASKHRDAIPVACIDDKCHVLTFNQYCRYRAEQCCSEQGQVSLTRHVPKLSEAPSSDTASMPLLDADPETVFLCRRVYDIKLKRVLKNPQAQWRDTPRLSSSAGGSESTLSLDVHLMNSGSILAPASKNLSP